MLLMPSLSFQKRRSEGYDELTTAALAVINAADDGFLFDFSSKATMLQSNGGAAVSAPGDPVGFIYDLSNHGYDAAQSDSGMRPTYREFSGVPCVEFDGGDVLQLLTFLDLYAAGTMSASVAVYGASQAAASVLSLGYTGSNTPLYMPLRGHTSSQMTTFLRTNANSTRVNNGNLTYGTLLNENWNVASFHDTGTNHRGRKNGNGGTWSNYNYTRSGTVSLDTIAIGALVRASVDTFFTGYIGRIAACTGVLSESDFDAIEAWCAAPAGVTLT